MKVRCNSCGKMIPYHGEVCPYCQADKSDAKKRLELVAYWGAGGGILTFLASLGIIAAKGGPIGGAFCIAFFGAIVGAVIGSTVELLRR